MKVQRRKGTALSPGGQNRVRSPARTYSLDTFDIHHFDARHTPQLPRQFGSRDEAQAAIDRFADGETCPCWYDPADPGIAVLVRGYQWWIWPALLVPASFVAIGVGGLVYTALYWGKSAERRAAAARKRAAPPNCSTCRRPPIPSSLTSPIAARSPAAPARGWPIACR